MPRKRKATVNSIARAQAARDALSAKRRKSTPAESDGDLDGTSDDELVRLKLLSKF